MGPQPHPELPRGVLPVTGAAIVSLLAVAIGLVVVGTIFLLRLRGDAG